MRIILTKVNFVMLLSSQQRQTPLCSVSSKAVKAKESQSAQILNLKSIKGVSVKRRRRKSSKQLEFNKLDRMGDLGSDQFICANCHVPANQRCTGCHETFYCSRECQKLHWKKHKNQCCAFKVSSDFSKAMTLVYDHQK